MLNPETITVLDPACGSGHILVVAYDVLKAIYLERGYRPRDIPRLILEKNLYGLDIDDRAAQLAGFALLMKARADDRRLFDDPPRLNVLALQESKGLNADELTRSLQPIAAIVGRVSPEGVTRQQAAGFAEGDLFPGTLPQMSLAESVTTEMSGYAALTRPTITALLDTFAEAKTFGSLIQIPPTLAKALPEMDAALLQALDSGDVFVRAAAEGLLPLVRQAFFLAMRFDTVVANPPYMGGKYYDNALKSFVDTHYKAAKGDLYTCFILQSAHLAKSGGGIGMISIPNWMFLASFADLRNRMVAELTIESLTHNGRGVFGSDFGSCAFVFRNNSLRNYHGLYKRLFDKSGSVASNEELIARFHIANPYQASMADFVQIPGSPIAYWASAAIRKCFREGVRVGGIAEPRQGMETSDNGRFLRTWSEVSTRNINFAAKNSVDAQESKRKWFPYAKGGENRKWFGNNSLVVNWLDGGREVLEFAASLYGSPTRTIKNIKYYFREALTWSLTSNSSLGFSARWRPSGYLFDVNGMSSFCDHDTYLILCALNSKIGTVLLSVINPTIAFQAGDIKSFPLMRPKSPEKVEEIALECIEIAAIDWNSFETSWDFLDLAWVRKANLAGLSLPASWIKWDIDCRCRFDRMRELETENNRIFIAAYGLQDEVSSAVLEDQITLARADREKDCQRLISYAIGCMMGRYRLDRPGLIYAHSGGQDFEAIYNAGREKFTDEQRLGNEHLCPSVSSLDKNPYPADADGIVPINESNWFDDDAANRVREFLLAIWGAETLNENMAWLAESLGQKSGETPDETICRYLSANFFKDHLQTYKRRPIYWCFSSGKQKAFEALVYLHRYHEGTLARMRMEYVVPLQGKMAARIDRLVDEIASASTTARAKRLQKERDKLTRQLDELRRYDEQLRHYADRRIALDLDDGVKVNYAKFGNLLAEVKTVTGISPD